MGCGHRIMGTNMAQPHCGQGSAACSRPWGFAPCAEHGPILSPLFLCRVTRLREEPWLRSHLSKTKTDFSLQHALDMVFCPFQPAQASTEPSPHSQVIDMEVPLCSNTTSLPPPVPIPTAEDQHVLIPTHKTNLFITMVMLKNLAGCSPASQQVPSSRDGSFQPPE